MDDDVFDILKIIAGIIVIIALFVCCTPSTNIESYNDGIHENCGGTLIYQHSVGHKYTTSYIFKCDKCNALVEVDSKDTTYAVIHYEDGSTKPAETFPTEEEYSDDYYAKHDEYDEYDEYDICNGTFDYED